MLTRREASAVVRCRPELLDAPAASECLEPHEPAAAEVTLPGVPLEQLAYEEAKRAIDRQSDQLDGLRNRAGILLAAIALATSFVGGLALRDADLSTSELAAGGVATAFALIAGGLCVAVLWPRFAWAFNLSAKDIIRQLDAERPAEATAYRELALRLEANYRDNEARLDRLFWLFRGACGALAAETVAWVVTLAV